MCVIEQLLAGRYFLVAVGFGGFNRSGLVFKVQYLIYGL